MTELRLADGEEVVRRYECTAVDNCAVFAGTVVPLRSKRARESKGTITVTNRRVVYDMESTKGYSESTIHQETRIEDISSVSSMIGKFGRDLRVPVLMVIVGFILIFAPYVYALESGALDTNGDYEAGYNAGVEYGYYAQFLSEIRDGAENTIPQGYHFEVDEFGSSEYMRGLNAGEPVGSERAVSDISSDRPFAVPTDLMMHNNSDTAILILAVIGAVVFILGSVLYVISNRTKDWICLRIGSGGAEGVAITSITGSSDRNGIRPLGADHDYSAMVTEIGSLIVEMRSKVQGLRSVEAMQ